jgi:hypothetical protein
MEEKGQDVQKFLEFVVEGAKNDMDEILDSIF